MELHRGISRRLHEEHQATLALWGRLERVLLSPTGRWPPTDPDTLGLLRRAAAALAEDITRHFQFEEEQLFPRLAAAGEGDIAELLAEEHASIRAAARQFAAGLAFDSFDSHGWDSLRAVVLELAERLVSHVQKEEMSMLPALDDLLDENADRELQLAYSN